MRNVESRDGINLKKIFGYGIGSLALVGLIWFGGNFVNDHFLTDDMPKYNVGESYPSLEIKITEKVKPYL